MFDNFHVHALFSWFQTKMSVTAPGHHTQNDANFANMFGSMSYANSQHTPQVMIDDRVVIKQKNKALKELDSRVKLATAQHNQMYKLQREHIVCEHQRQMQLAVAGIEDEKAAALLALEQAYSQNIRAIDHSAQSQKISIEQQANILEIHSIQHQMAVQHADRERQWNSNYSVAPTTQYFSNIANSMAFSPAAN